jgi:pyruvate, water dikinase
MGIYVKPFREMSKKDSEEAGGKAANLSEMTQAGMNVPPGFCVTAGSLQHLIDANGLQPKIDEIIASFDYEDYEGMEAKTAEIREMIAAAPIPADLLAEIKASIQELVGADDAFVAVRSSVSVKGMPISSFPGMMDTFHYLKGEEEIVHHIRMCWASLWTMRAAYNRFHKQIDHHLGLIAPIVQKMVFSEIAGILFTANPITGARDEMVIEANWGLGESVVSGKSMNDFFLIDRNNKSEKQRKIQRKTVWVTFDDEKGWGRKEEETPPDLVMKPTLSEDDVRELVDIGFKIEALFGGFPQDIEWAIAGGQKYVLQARNIRNLVGS